MEDLKLYYGTETNYKDVTDIIFSNFVDENILKISLGTNFNDYFNDENNGQIKHLKICYGSKRLFVRENSEIMINLNTLIHYTYPKIHCVYLINTFISTYFASLFYYQLDNLKIFNIHDKFSYHIVALADNKNKFELLKIIPNLNLNISSITFFNENTHEYRGIEKAHTLSKLYPTDIICYFHSKGITRLNSALDPHNAECFIHNNLLFRDVENKLFWLVVCDEIQKIGYSSKKGWCWYNYWFVKSSYLKNNVTPEFIENRYYDEFWLSYNFHDKSKIKSNMIINTARNLKKNIFDIGSYYDPELVNHFFS